jgi:hypothetical protein
VCVVVTVTAVCVCDAEERKESGIEWKGARGGQPYLKEPRGLAVRGLTSCNPNQNHVDQEMTTDLY